MPVRILLLLVCVQFPVMADDWPQWLGPTRDGVWRESGVVDSFPEGGPKLLWKKPIGGGYSGPAVAGGHVFVFDWVATKSDGKPKLLHDGEPPRNTNFLRKLLPGTERVHCLDAETGDVVWTHEYDCPYSSATTYAIGPRATPTVDGGRVYTAGAEGNLFCLSVPTGDVIWSKDYKTDYKVKVPTWGLASPPLVDGDKLICIVGGSGTTCVAFDKRTGKELWRSLSSGEPGYSAPVIREVAGHRQLIVWDSDAVHGLNPEDGKELWSVPFKSTYAMSVATPQVSGNSLFLMCFNGKCGLVRVGDDGQSAKLAWNGSRRVGIDGVHNTAHMVDGHIYGCANGGRYVCAKMENGERVWSSFEPASAKRPITWGNVFTIPHEDRYFLANDKGELIIATMNPDGYKQISKAKLIEPTHQVGSRKLVWSHPAFANRSVYLRNDEEIRVYSLAK